MSLYAHYAALLDGVLDDLASEGALPAGLDRRSVTVEPPRDSTHGDLATNVAMVLAKAVKTNPRALAELIKPKLEALPPVNSVVWALAINELNVGSGCTWNEVLPGATWSGSRSCRSASASRSRASDPATRGGDS